MTSPAISTQNSAQNLANERYVATKSSYSKIVTQQINLMIVSPFVAYLAAEAP